MSEREANGVEAITLALHCPHCGGAIAVEVTDWRAPELATSGDGTPLAKQFFTCPYCQREQDVELPGRIVWVTAGHREPTVS